ncbi:hypothetical protein ACFLYR_07595 [Chloroflexota bacterium]
MTVTPPLPQSSRIIVLNLTWPQFGQGYRSESRDEMPADRIAVAFYCVGGNVNSDIVPQPLV